MDKEYKGLGLIHDYLVGIGARGEEKRCPAIILTKAVGAADTRQLQEWIAAERDPHDPILASSRGGYFLRAHGLQ
ncbi:MAG: hypothetical protein IJJ43_01195 [Oscillospiraceae bacterium]|nr:hypothetical protein [Oscillospiraceae bacterium]